MAQPRKPARKPPPAPRPRARAAKTKRRPGRPTKLSPEATAQLEQLVRAGTTIDVAAAAVGISRATLYSWLKQGEKARAGTATRDLRDRVERARAESESVLVAGSARRPPRAPGRPPPGCSSGAGPSGG